jgi:hypothetical protein
MSYRLVVAGLALESLSEPRNGDQWVSSPSPLEWDDLDGAVVYAVSESNERGGQAVEVVDEGTGIVQVRVTTPQTPSDALAARLELRDDFPQ